MELLALPISYALGAILGPAGVQALETARLRAVNYRGELVACPSGVIALSAALVALAPLVLLDELAGTSFIDPDLRLWLPYVVGVGLLGMLDDALGRGGEPGSPRGWRGHAAALLEGQLSTGALKAIGALGLAAITLSGLGLSAGDYLIAVAILVLATNLVNLFDLRPGRAEKALLIPAVLLCLGAWTLEPVRQLGIFLGPLLAVMGLNLRERSMLGDAGSNVLGALLGAWLLITLSTDARIVALVVLVALTAYGEFRSLNTAIERFPLLRRLDSIGRR